MPCQHRSFLVAAAQLLLRKLADSLVHAVAPALGIRRKDHQRVVDQLGENFGARLPRRADRLGSF